MTPTTPATGGLLAFLAARLDEDERYLKSNSHHLWTRRPLREVAAKRAIIAITLQYEQTIDSEWGCCHEADEIAAGKCDDIDPDEIETLRHLAAVYSDHPDYRAGWTSTPVPILDPEADRMAAEDRKD